MAAAAPVLAPNRPPLPKGPVDVLMIDNYDSFTYNLVQYLEELGARVTTVRHDHATLEEVEALAPARIVISPGPGAPKDAGISMEVIKRFAGRVPILGVCLGLQCTYEVYGGTVRAEGIGNRRRGERATSAAGCTIAGAVFSSSVDGRWTYPKP